MYKVYQAANATFQGGLAGQVGGWVEGHLGSDHFFLSLSVLTGSEALEA